MKYTIDVPEYSKERMNQFRKLKTTNLARMVGVQVELADESYIRYFVDTDMSHSEVSEWMDRFSVDCLSINATNKDYTTETKQADDFNINLWWSKHNKTAQEVRHEN